MVVSLAPFVVKAENLGASGEAAQAPAEGGRPRGRSPGCGRGWWSRRRWWWRRGRARRYAVRRVWGQLRAGRVLDRLRHVREVVPRQVCQDHAGQGGAHQAVQVPVVHGRQRRRQRQQQAGAPVLLRPAAVIRWRPARGDRPASPRSRTELLLQSL
jgi:hypothetical protein